MRRKAVRRRAVRAGLLFGNVVILAALLVFVIQNQHTQASGSAQLNSAIAPTAAANPLDQLSSASIAVNVARLNGLPEATAITHQAESQEIELATAATNNDVVAKPQAVSTSLKSKADIQAYTTVAGDTVSSLAAKFGVTSDSIRWSNSLTGDALSANVKLTIPPVNGIVYTVKAGDTADSLAVKYKANKDRIIAFNDAEINGLQTGEQILIPDGNVVAAPVATYGYSAAASYGGFAWGGNAPIYGSNGYDFGYCTWYVATKVAVPSNWGNANTWDRGARASGWTVSTTPIAGAVGQTSAGYLGHVAYVEAVSEDGTMIKYSDMNALAGWGRVGYSEWVPANHFPHYIYQ